MPAIGIEALGVWEAGRVVVRQVGRDGDDRVGRQQDAPVVEVTSDDPGQGHQRMDSEALQDTPPQEMHLGDRCGVEPVVLRLLWMGSSSRAVMVPHLDG